MLEYNRRKEGWEEVEVHAEPYKNPGRKKRAYRVGMVEGAWFVFEKNMITKREKPTCNGVGYATEREAEKALRRFLGSSDGTTAASKGKLPPSVG